MTQLCTQVIHHIQQCHVPLAETVDSYQRHLLAAPVCIRSHLKEDLADRIAQVDPNAAASTQPIKHGNDYIQLSMGIDEAGRGPLLGSVVVAAVILPESLSVDLQNELGLHALQQSELAVLNDSKKLSEKKRDLLLPRIQRHALAYAIAEVPAKVIDQLNILQATLLGMRLCAEHLLLRLAQIFPVSRVHCDLLIDGNRCPVLDESLLKQVGYQPSQYPSEAWVKGDGRHSSIAAASILAKVSRDQQMYALAKTHPGYGIDQHKGYPTKAHLKAIATQGILPEHRRSFAPIKALLTYTFPKK